ncbi:MAG: GGDEF domain-containing protein [Sphingomonadaceae bacterium]
MGNKLSEHKTSNWVALASIAFCACAACAGALAAESTLKFANASFPLIAAFGTSLIVATLTIFQLYRRLIRDLEIRLERVYQLVKFDGLTGLLNRTFFLDQVRAQRQDGYFLIVDADRFKAINDNHGHYTGDAALVHISRTIESSVGQSGYVGRLGGEEFGIFLPGADLGLANEVSERTRSNVEHSNFCPNLQKLPLTISIGVSVHFCKDPISTAFKLADENLYAAKAAGRNRVMFATNIVHDMRAKLGRRATFANEVPACDTDRARLDRKTIAAWAGSMF